MNEIGRATVRRRGPRLPSCSPPPWSILHGPAGRSGRSDAWTGAEIYGRQRIDVGQAFTASPWAYNGKLFALSLILRTAEAVYRIAEPLRDGS